MAYSVGIGDRHEDARYRATSTSTSSDESSFSFYNPPLRANNVNRLSAHMPATSDSRALLQRRFTTQGVATMSSLSNMAQLRRQPVDPPIHDASFSVRKLTTLLSFTIYRDAIAPLGSYFLHIHHMLLDVSLSFIHSVLLSLDHILILALLSHAPYLSLSLTGLVDLLILHASTRSLLLTSFTRHTPFTSSSLPLTLTLNSCFR